jgi:hypothetical protein
MTLCAAISNEWLLGAAIGGADALLHGRVRSALPAQKSPIKPAYQYLSLSLAKAAGRGRRIIDGLTPQGILHSPLAPEPRAVRTRRAAPQRAWRPPRRIDYSFLDAPL